MLSRPMLNRMLFGPVSWYAALIVFGILVGYMLASKESRRMRLPDDLIIDFLLTAIPLGIIGARLYYVFFRFEDYSENLISVLFIHEGGLAVYGGLIGGLLAARITARRHNVALSDLLDLLAPSFVLAQAVGRWGNYINMEAYGLRVSEESLQFFPFAVEVPVGSIWYWHMATFFYEFCADLLIFFLLLVLRRRRPFSGSVFCWYLLLYTSARTVIEGLRDDSLTFISDFVRISQVLSGLAAFGVIIYFFIRIRDRISLVTFLPLLDSLFCVALVFLGEFERNAYSFLFRFSQACLLLLLLLKIGFIVLWTLDCGRFELRILWPLLLCCLADALIWVFGLGRANEDNTYYVSFRQIAGMTQLCVDGWLLCFPLCPANRNRPGENQKAPYGTK